DAHRVVRDASYRVRARTPLLCRLLTSSFPAEGAPVARVIVDVMPKPEILDPQGTAVHAALGRTGFDAVSDVRQGKRFELTVATADAATLEEIPTLAARLVSHPRVGDDAVRADES